MTEDIANTSCAAMLQDMENLAAYIEIVQAGIPLPTTKSLGDRSGFQNLPLELTVYILQELHALDIVRCKQVCSALRNLIISTSSLKHKINLFLIGVVELSCDKPLRTRMNALYHWRSHTRYYVCTQEWTERAYSDSVEHSICGPVLARDSETRPGLELRRFPSDIREVDAKTWQLDDLPPYDHFACDYDQDLLVLIQSFFDSTLVKLHLLSCTTGKQHALVKEGVIEVALDDTGEGGFREFRTRITGDHVGLVIIHYNEDLSDNHSEVWVCDWKQCKVVLNVHGRVSDGAVPTGFAFLDGRHVLVVTGDITPVRAVVAFDCLSFPSGRHTMVAAIERNASLVLDLPKMAQGPTSEMNNTITSCPRLSSVVRAAAAAASCADDEPWFRWTDDAPVVVVSIEAHDTAGDIREFRIFIPGHALTARLATHEEQTAASGDMRPAGAVPWCEWACDALLKDVSYTWTSPSVCGSKYVTAGQVERLAIADGELVQVQDTVAVVYHFDSRPSIAQDNIVDNRELDAAEHDSGLPRVYRVMGERPPEAPDPTMWAETVGGGAWYRQIWTDVEFDHGPESVYIVEDGLVVLGRNNLGEGEIRAYTI